MPPRKSFPGLDINLASQNNNRGAGRVCRGKKTGWFNPALATLARGIVNEGHFPPVQVKSSTKAEPPKLICPYRSLTMPLSADWLQVLFFSGDLPKLKDGLSRQEMECRSAARRAR